MTDEPAPTPAVDRVTALTLRCGQLREQRDEARREGAGWFDALTATLARVETAERERDMARQNAALFSKQREKALNGWAQAERERDQARAQAVAATTDADDLRARVGHFRKWYLEAAGEVDRLATIRARVEAVVAPWPPGIRKGDVLRAIGEGK